MEVTVPDNRPNEPQAARTAPAQARPVVPQTPTPNWGQPTTAPLNGPWVAPSLWARRWPGPFRPAGTATLLAIGVAAIVAALSVPLDRAGVGWLLTAVAGVAALVIAQRVPDRLSDTAPKPLVARSAWPTPRLTAARYGWTAATVALFGIGTLRSAGWLFVLCLLTAAVTGALAVAGGRSLRAMVVATLMAPIAALRALPWVIRGLAGIKRTSPGSASGLRIAATVAVSFALLVVFGALFASADENFARILERAVPDIDVPTVVRWVFVGTVAAGVLFGAAFLRAAPPDLSGLESPGTAKVRRLEWAMPLGTLVLLFAAFVAVQLTTLFGGDGHVQGTDDLTYAGFARGGFWQLLVVTGLTLVVLAGAARWAPRQSTTDRVLIRVVLGALSLLTLVIVASALHRMDLYADSYGLTRLRVLVALCEMWLGAVFVMVLVAGIRLRAAWLPQAAVAVGVAALIGLGAANPDALIAENNVSRFQQSGRIDTQYLSTLSADAVPALDRLPDPQRSCALNQIGWELSTDVDDEWREWNLGRMQARDILAVRPPITSRECPGWFRD
jgi:hypothetical protein